MSAGKLSGSMAKRASVIVPLTLPAGSLRSREVSNNCCIAKLFKLTHCFKTVWTAFSVTPVGSTTFNNEITHTKVLELPKFSELDQCLFCDSTGLNSNVREGVDPRELHEKFITSRAVLNR